MPHTGHKGGGGVKTLMNSAFLHSCQQVYFTYVPMCLFMKAISERFARLSSEDQEVDFPSTTTTMAKMQ